MKKVKADGFDNQFLFVLPRDYTDAFCDDPLFSHFRVTDIGYFPSARYHYRRRPDGIEEGILLLCVSGEGYYSIGGCSPVALTAGQSVMIPPNAAHYYGASEEDPWSVYWFHFVGSALPALSSALSQYQPLKAETVDVDGAISLFRRCFEILKRPYQRDEYFSVCQYALAVCALLNLAAKRADLPLTEKGSVAIQNAIEFMKHNLNRKLTLEQIAGAANFSVPHLHSLFKASTGHSPMDYFLRMKIQAAGKELYFTDRQVKEIAVHYGICDSCYFSRIFKKIMGMSPLEYRRQTKG